MAETLTFLSFRSTILGIVGGMLNDLLFVFLNLTATGEWSELMDSKISLNRSDQNLDDFSNVVIIIHMAESTCSSSSWWRWLGSSRAQK